MGRSLDQMLSEEKPHVVQAANAKANAFIRDIDVSELRLTDAQKGDFFVSNFVESDRVMIEEALERSGNTDRAVLGEALDMFGKPMLGWFGLYGLTGFCAPSFYLALNAKQDSGEALNTLEVLGA